MRIGIFVLAAGRNAGGPETYEVELIRALARIDAENEYFVYCTSRESADALAVSRPNFTCRVLRPALRAVSVALTLPRWMAADRIGFFHATYAPPPLTNVPFLFTMHCASNFARPDFYPTLKRWRLNALQRAGLRRAGNILCVSNFVAEYVRASFGVRPERLRTIYNGASRDFSPMAPETARARVAGQYGLEGPYILYVGKLQARKNVAGLIRAYARYRQETNSEAKLVLAGRRVETSEEIDEAIRALGLGAHIVELGHVSHPSNEPGSLLPSLYRAARMTVLPSFYEGFGIPVVEAMACGSPVIVSSTTSLPEIAGDAALAVDPHSPRKIAAAMAELDRNSALRECLVQRGLSRAGLFTWENCARETLDAYRTFALTTAKPASTSA